MGVSASFLEEADEGAQHDCYPLHGALLVDQEEEERIRGEMKGLTLSYSGEEVSGYTGDESSVPGAAVLSTSSSPDSSCNGREAEDLSTTSVASLVERLFLEHQEKEATFASEKMNLSTCSSISSTSTSPRRRRIIQVFQTYQTGLVPRSRMPQGQQDDDDDPIISRSFSSSSSQLPRSHIPFRKCRHLQCKCHDHLGHSIASETPNISESFSSITEDTSTRVVRNPSLTLRQHSLAPSFPDTPSSDKEDLVGLLVDPAPIITTPKTSNNCRKRARTKTAHKTFKWNKQRARSEDFVDHGALIKPLTPSTASSKQQLNIDVAPSIDPPRRSRANSCHTTGMVKTRLTINATSTKAKTRCRSEDIIDGERGVGYINSKRFHDDPSSISQTFRESPTSVAAFPHPKDLKASQEASSSKRRRTSTKTSHPLEATLQTYRTSLDAIKQQRKLPKLERAMQLSTTYHQMALIHHQLGRYQTALHVLDHAVEVLIQAAANAAAVAGAFHPSRHNDDDISDDTPDPSHLPLLNETIPFLSSKSLLLVATMFTVQAKAYIAQGLHDTAKDRVEQVMICLGNERARRRIGHPVPYVNGGAHSVTTEWSLTMARAQVVLGQCYQQQRCPDVAMRCFQDALHIQRHLLGDWHVQVVDTVKCIGDLHLSQCVLGHAFGCYQEALRVYRHLMATEQYRRHDFHSLSCLRADTSTLLTSLGWISLLQHDLHSAWDMSLEAHQLAMQSNGLCHRNMASIRYQLGWIQWWSSPSVPDSPRIVLSQWKWVLKHQEQALNRGSLEEENHHRYNVEDGKYSSIHRHPHVDLAKTLHAIGHAYHAIGHSGKSCCAIQAAEEIYRVNLPQALQRYDQKQ